LIKPLFVDTTAWYALADNGDRHHAEAVRILAELKRDRRRLITTNHVVSETYALARARLGMSTATQILTQFRTSVMAQRIHVTEVWESAAEDLLTRYDDQEFSYVDATSFVVMSRLTLQEAFAFDHHFSTAGFLLYG
jgi:predicted nucleic acid-binding protein